MTSTTLVWFRSDLRVADNPALRAAVECGGRVIPVFVWAPEEEGPWQPGAASRWWLHQSLAALDRALRRAGSQLIIRRGPTLNALQSLVKETGVNAVFWNRRYEPAILARDAAIMEGLREAGVGVESFNAALLHEPWTIRNQSSKPFRIFTPFWRHCLSQPEPGRPLPAPQTLKPPGKWPKSLAFAELELEPRINWTEGLRAAWQPGEAGAQANLKLFLETALQDYDEARNRLDRAATSRLSPHLHFGEISPRQVWQGIKAGRGVGAAPTGDGERETAGWGHRALPGEQFLTELGWREFAHHLLFHFPATPQEPLRPEFARFPWRHNERWLRAWQRGQTGYPLVDAGMRELWTSGWMHNRARMVVASFFVKHLLTDWAQGARWFWDTLVDADLANNTLGWQWTAGCGADAAPYFRVFNPVSQGEKFDPEGAYVRHWVREIARLPDKWIHQPWNAPAEALSRAGIRLGFTYPQPIVGHFVARQVALEAYAKTRKGEGKP